MRTMNGSGSYSSKQAMNGGDRYKPSIDGWLPACYRPSRSPTVNGLTDTGCYRTELIRTREVVDTQTEL